MVASVWIGWVIIVVPLALAVLTVAAGRRGLGVMQYGVVLGPLLALVVGAQGLAAADRAVAASVPWLMHDGAGLTMGVRIDPLSSLMLVIVGVVAACVMVFSVGYMHGEEGRVRYVALLSLFVAAMSALVLADTLPMLFLGWELVGACSYLLIGFWYQRPSAVKAAMKAFLTTRVGDVGMLLGLAILWKATGSLAIDDVLGAVSELPTGTVTAAALLLFVGAAGKSAQFPLHIWLPDAMEGPTPVSALIHAATMVASGVFLLARMDALMAASATARVVVLAIGALTAIGAAVVACTQTDIKKVLAYSTISQLGFMFAALGVGAWGAAMFHLTTHAAFKALLFLAAGSVIHGTHTQDLREMGGLSRSMPVTTTTWLVGGFALAGIWPFAGFFSKDEIIAEVLHGAPVAGWVLLAASMLTAFYVTRATYLAFFGARRSTAEVHESPGSMAVPLVVLAVLTATLGVTKEACLEAIGSDVAAPAFAPIAFALMAAVLGIFAGLAVYRGSRTSLRTAIPRLARFADAAQGGFSVDTVVDHVVVRPTLALARGLSGLLDQRVIDRVAEGIGALTVRLGGAVRGLQTGETDVYASLIVVGFVVLMGLGYWLGRG